MVKQRSFAPNLVNTETNVLPFKPFAIHPDSTCTEHSFPQIFGLFMLETMNFKIYPEGIRQCFSKYGPLPVISTLTMKLEMQSLRFHTRSNKSRTLGLNPSNGIYKKCKLLE